MNRRCHYVVEIHDVCPGTLAAVETILGRLPEAARSLAALLVVPNWGGTAPMSGDPLYVARLRALSASVVLHGLTHERGSNLWNRVCYGTADHAEFEALSVQQARDRLERGVAMFEAAFGERPQWFCAPRWRQGSGTLAALAAAGIPWCMLRDRYSSTTGAEVRLPAIDFDPGPLPWRRAVTRVWALARVRRELRSGTPFRLVIHPRDLHDARSWRAITAVVDGLARASWVPMSIDQVVGR